jgi:hypothetical protein
MSTPNEVTGEYLGFETTANDDEQPMIIILQEDSQDNDIPPSEKYGMKQLRGPVIAGFFLVSLLIVVAILYCTRRRHQRRLTSEGT